MELEKGKDLNKKWHEIIRIVEAQDEKRKLYYIVDENYNFIPLIKEYLDMIQGRGEREVSPNTAKTYCYLLWYFMVFLKIKGLGILDLDGKPEILVRFKQWLMNPYRLYENIELLPGYLQTEYTNDKLSVTTMNAILDRVSSLYLWLKASNRIEDNPVLYSKVIRKGDIKDRDMLSHTKHEATIRKNSLKIKTYKNDIKTVSNKNFKGFLDSLKLLRDKVIALILKEGGLRAGELLGIHLEDIDFAEQGIWIRFRPDNINNARAKAGYGRDRFVHLPSELIALVDDYISSEWINSNAETDFLFVVINSGNLIYNGKPMTKSTLDSMFKYYSKKTGVKIHPHQLRHTHATELARQYLNNGELINWEYISKRLGHSSVTTTMDIYAHLTVEDYKKEYKKLQEYREKVKENRA